VFGTSHVLVVDEVLSNNELKPEKPYGDQAALNVLSCVVIAFGNSCQEIMDAQSQLLIYGVLPEHKIMVAERKKVRRLVKTSSTPVGVPLPSYRYGRERGAYAQNYSSEGIILMRS